ncbi:hypothetical protein [Shinella sp. WSJ-2]|uniref:hypothetical protein n=1 Tax=Shinella sp. WSJ-2 TaxID=2303749 RepID=UPI0011C13BEF|nr:hypothetical protein [Shinella sp. WSJ-2]
MKLKTVQLCAQQLYASRRQIRCPGGVARTPIDFPIAMQRPARSANNLNIAAHKDNNFTYWANLGRRHNGRSLPMAIELPASGKDNNRQMLRKRRKHQIRETLWIFSWCSFMVGI